MRAEPPRKQFGDSFHTFRLRLYSYLRWEIDTERSSNLFPARKDDMMWDLWDDYQKSAQQLTDEELEEWIKKYRDEYYAPYGVWRGHPTLQQAFLTLEDVKEKRLYPPIGE